jgi:hypothetical protein
LPPNIDTVATSRMRKLVVLSLVSDVGNTDILACSCHLSVLWLPNKIHPGFVMPRKEHYTHSPSVASSVNLPAHYPVCRITASAVSASSTVPT